MSIAYKISDAYHKVASIDGIDVTTDSSGDVYWIIEIDGERYYYDTAWVSSDMTLAQSNTATDFNLNCSTLPLNDVAGSEVRLIAVNDFLISPTEVLHLELDHSKVCKLRNTGVNVHFNLIGINYNNGQNVKVTAKLSNYNEGKIVYLGETLYPTTVEGLTDENGELLLNLMSNQLIVPAGTYWNIKIGDLPVVSVSVPNLFEINYNDLLPAIP